MKLREEARSELSRYFYAYSFMELIGLRTCALLKIYFKRQ